MAKLRVPSGQAEATEAPATHPSTPIDTSSVRAEPPQPDAPVSGGPFHFAAPIAGGGFNPHKLPPKQVSSLWRREGHPASVGKNAEVITISTRDELESLRRSLLPGQFLVVDFSMEGCPPCRELHPVYKEAARRFAIEAPGQFVFARTENTDLAVEFNVGAFPTVIAFDSDQNRCPLMAGFTKGQDGDLLQQLRDLRLPLPERLESARRALASSSISKQIEARYRYLSLIPRMGEGDIVREAEALRSLIEKGNGDTQLDAARLYGALAARFQPDFASAEAEKLQLLLTPACPPDERKAVFVALGSLRGAAAVRPFFDDPNTEVRVAALSAYGYLSEKISDSEALEAGSYLRVLWRRPNSSIAAAAIRTYGRLAHRFSQVQIDSAGEDLLTRFSSWDFQMLLGTFGAFDDLVPRMSTEAVARQIDPLIRLAESPPPVISTTAMNLIGLMSGKLDTTTVNRLAQGLRKKFDDPDAAIASTAIRTYVLLGPSLGDRERVTGIRRLQAKRFEEKFRVEATWACDRLLDAYSPVKQFFLGVPIIGRLI